FRHDPEGPRSWIRIHGDARTAWHRSAVAALQRAGYTRTLRFKDETVCERWLRTRRECGAELEFLANLPDDARPAIAREPSLHARANRPSTLLDLLEAARAAPIAWEECALGFEHRERLRGELRGFSLLVAALGVQDREGQRFQSFVSVFDPA